MRWPDVRTAYPDQWLVIEALQAHTEDNRRILDQISNRRRGNVPRFGNSDANLSPASPAISRARALLCAYQPHQPGHRRATLGRYQEERCGLR